jgi:RNA polymerase sigma-70 factor (ECF subfamily)
MAPMDLERTTTALLAALHDSANADAWGLFDRRYRPILIGFARSCGLSEHDAAEVAQSTLVRFIEQYREGRYDRGRGRLGAWLVTIARYRVLDHRRKVHSIAVTARESTIVNLDDDRSVGDAYEAQRRLAILREAMVELRERTKTDPRTIRAFELLYYHGMTVQAVAADLGMQAQDVYLAKSRIAARVREIVARIEQEYEEEPGEWTARGARPSDSFGSI